MIEEILFALCLLIAIVCDRLALKDNEYKLVNRIKELEFGIKHLYDEAKTHDKIMKDNLVINIPSTIYEQGGDDCKPSESENESENENENESENENDYNKELEEILKSVVALVEEEVNIRNNDLKKQPKLPAEETVTEVYDRRSSLRSATTAAAAAAAADATTITLDEDRDDVMTLKSVLDFVDDLNNKDNI